MSTLLISLGLSATLHSLPAHWRDAEPVVTPVVLRGAPACAPYRAQLLITDRRSGAILASPQLQLPQGGSSHFEAGAGSGMWLRVTLSALSPEQVTLSTSVVRDGVAEPPVTQQLSVVAESPDSPTAH
ncbi:MAG: hypothetical protein ACK4F7_08015 [Inhella sp.]